MQKTYFNVLYGFRKGIIYVGVVVEDALDNNSFLTLQIL